MSYKKVAVEILVEGLNRIQRGLPLAEPIEDIKIDVTSSSDNGGSCDIRVDLPQNPICVSVRRIDGNEEDCIERAWQAVLDRILWRAYFGDKHQDEYEKRVEDAKVRSAELQKLAEISYKNTGHPLGMGFLNTTIPEPFFDALQAVRSGKWPDGGK